MLDPSIAAGSGVAKAMADMVGGGSLINTIMQMLMILALKTVANKRSYAP